MPKIAFLAAQTRSMQCMQLTQAEDAFRISKGDLSLRPVYHHKPNGAEAHILVLLFEVWPCGAPWKCGCAARDWATAPAKLLKEAATVRSLDVALPVEGPRVSRLAFAG